MKHSSVAHADYMPQLDGVRAIAAGLVVYDHIFPQSRLFGNWGSIGVRLFFVLSGFLITGILLDMRSNDGRPRGSLRAFYIRRGLRIFPIYYLTLAVIAIVVPPRSYQRLQFASYLGYWSNWFICFHGDTVLIAGHFWSLAVEEQFYLVWPWLILFLPSRMLLPAILSALFIAPFVRLFLIIHGLIVPISFNTLGCLDTLGAGALLAYTRRVGGRDAANRLACLAGLAAFPLMFLGLGSGLWPTHYVALYTLRDTFWACLFLWIVWKAASGFTGPLGLILQSTPMTYIGRISYGIYVYHAFGERFGPWIFDRLGIPYPNVGYTRAVVLTVLSIAIATLSWHLIEAPINGLKSKFPYRPATCRS